MKDPDELLHLIALTLVPQIGSVHSRILLETIGSACEIFKSKRSLLEKIPGIGSIRAKNISGFKDLRRAEKELSFIERYKIKPLLFNQPEFPQRLKQCEDPPVILFYKGNADLNIKKVVSIVGTRKQTDYGRFQVEHYLEAWKGIDMLIVSGLAYGIDQIAHRNSLRLGLATVGVLANGLDTIYPSSHTSLAKEMILNGGLITEFLSGTKPDKQNFPRRNRIVAGMCDALLVVETDIKGGSMITAEMAGGYNREIFALPGRLTDRKSAGCNRLIRDNKARLSSCPDDVIEFMNWDLEPRMKQQFIFPELNDDASLLWRHLKEHGAIHVDRLYTMSGLKRSSFHPALLNLELEGMVEQAPGGVYVLKRNQV
jgi:DNA processing protein